MSSPPEKSTGDKRTSQSGKWKPGEGSKALRGDFDGSLEKEEEILDTCEEMSWVPGKAELFELRSKDYMQSSVKQASGPSLYEVFALDLFHTKKKPDKMERAFEFPDLPAVESPRKTDIPPLLILHMVWPKYRPPLWGHTTDGESACSVVWANLSDWSREKIKKDELSPSLKLWENFCKTANKNGESPYWDRFKAMMRLRNVDECKDTLGYLLTTLLSQYNAKPFLCRSGESKWYSARYEYITDKYLIIRIDGHTFRNMSKTIGWQLRDVPAMGVCDFGVTIEGRDEDELPEQTLICWRQSKMDFDRLDPFIPPKVQE